MLPLTTLTHAFTNITNGLKDSKGYEQGEVLAFSFDFAVNRQLTYTMMTQMVDRFLLDIYFLATYQPFVSSLYMDRLLEDTSV